MHLKTENVLFVHQVEAINTLLDLLESTDPQVRMQAASILLHSFPAYEMGDGQPPLLPHDLEVVEDR